MIEILLCHFPISQFQLEDQETFFSSAFRLGHFESVDLLVKRGFNPSERDFDNLNSFSKWLNGGAKIAVPALNSYKQFDRTLDSRHHSLYGGEEIQDIYQSKVKESVVYALWEMNRAKMSNDWRQSFDILLIAIGDRRGHIAQICNSKDKKYFGLKRLQIIETPLINHYEGYLDRYEHQKKVVVTLENQKYLLTNHTKNFAPNDPFGSGPLRSTISNLCITFWEKDSPLFLHVASIYQKIISEDWSSKPNELKNEIASFHWHLANIVPFVRGTASTLETITDAMWLFHGYIPKPTSMAKAWT